MAVYRQILTVGDYEGSVTWELLLGSNYSELFEDEAQDVDIISIGKLKFEGESQTLEQKEDEIDFELNEAAIRTQADADCAALMQQSEYSDVWTALFEYETGEYAMSIDRLVFSGLVRRKASGQDLVWSNAPWSPDIAPLRVWKYSAQAFGCAVLDKVSLADTQEDGETLPGVLSMLNEDNLAVTDIEMFKIKSKWDIGPEGTAQDRLYYRKACNLNRAIRVLIEFAQARIRQTIPEFEISLKQTLSAYSYAPHKVYSKGEAIEGQVSRAFLLKENIAAYDNSAVQMYIDANLLIPPRMESGEIDREYSQLSWHRYKSVTELLYNLSVCFGCVLRIRNISPTHIELAFEPVLGNYGKQLHLLDADSADIDIQSTRAGKQDFYYLRATQYCDEGYDYCYGDKFRNPSYIESKNSNSSKSEPLPLSVSVTNQLLRDMRDFYGSSAIFAWQANDILQNTDLISDYRTLQNYHKTHKTAWTGMLFPINTVSGTGITTGFPWEQYWAVAAMVATTINGQNYWYSKLGDLLNSRISKNGEIFETEYKIELPYIKSFSSSADGSNPSLHNLKLFDKLTLDNKEYTITKIEISPSDGRLSIELARKSKYGFAEPEPLPAGSVAGTLPGEAFAGDEDGIVEIAEPGLIPGDLVMYGEDGILYPYINYDNYNRYAGIVSAISGGNIAIIRVSGKIDTIQELIPGRPVYARYNSVLSKCVPSSNRLIRPTIHENADVCIGKAISEHTFIIEKGKEFIVL